jgi:predicted small metal-binding protein
MADDKSIGCDCGYRLRARTEQRQVAEVRRHAWEAHGISFSTEEALAVLLRRELELHEGDLADLPTLEDKTRGKEKR